MMGEANECSIGRVHYMSRYAAVGLIALLGMFVYRGFVADSASPVARASGKPDPDRINERRHGARPRPAHRLCRTA